MYAKDKDDALKAYAVQEIPVVETFAQKYWRYLAIGGLAVVIAFIVYVLHHI